MDWGLGHATRCVPLIRKLQSENKIIIGVTPSTSLIFDEEFPELPKLSVEPYAISYSKIVPLWFKLLLDYPRIYKVTKKERMQLEEIIVNYKIDVVISDNRFGLYNSQVHCIYISHQLQIQAGIFSGLANWIHGKYINHFQEIWVPDFENTQQALAGELSRNTSFNNVKYIGPLSRLQFLDGLEKLYDYLCILSGPEPERSNLETLLMQQAVRSDKKICLVRGTHKPMEDVPPLNVTVFDLPSASQLSYLIGSSHKIICRSGYSTLMDLYTINNLNCLLIPTPGQKEQVYLAHYWQKKFNVELCHQSKLSAFDF